MCSRRPVGRVVALTGAKLTALTDEAISTSCTAVAMQEEFLLNEARTFGVEVNCFAAAMALHQGLDTYPFVGIETALIDRSLSPQ